MARRKKNKRRKSTRKAVAPREDEGTSVEDAAPAPSGDHPGDDPSSGDARSDGARGDHPDDDASVRDASSGSVRGDRAADDASAGDASSGSARGDRAAEDASAGDASSGSARSDRAAEDASAGDASSDGARGDGPDDASAGDASSDGARGDRASSKPTDAGPDEAPSARAQAGADDPPRPGARSKAAPLDEDEPGGPVARLIDACGGVFNLALFAGLGYLFLRSMFHSPAPEPGGPVVVHVIRNQGLRTVPARFAAAGQRDTPDPRNPRVATSFFLPPEGQPASPSALAFDPRAGRLAVGESSGRVSVFDLETGAREEWSGQGGHPVLGLAWIREDRLAVTDAGGGACSLAQGQAPECWIAPQPSALRRSTFTPGCGRLFTSTGSAAYVIDPETGDVERMLPYRAAQVDRVHGLVPSADGRLVASLGPGARVWNADSGAPLFQLDCDRGWTPGAAFGPEGRMLAAGCDDWIHLWDVPGAAPLRQVRTGMGTVRTFAFSPDARFLAAAGQAADVYLWDLGGSAHLALRGHRQHPVALAFSARGDRLGSVAGDGRVLVWDMDAVTALRR